MTSRMTKRNALPGRPMVRVSAAAVCVAALTLSGCGSDTGEPASTTPSAQTGGAVPDTVAPDNPASPDSGDTSPAPAATVSAATNSESEPLSPQQSALRTAVGEYSDAYYGGDSDAAYAMMSARCQKATNQAVYAKILDEVTDLYEGPVDITEFSATINGSKAQATYSYVIGALDKENEPWVLEASNWRFDGC